MGDLRSESKLWKVGIRNAELMVHHVIFLIWPEFLESLEWEIIDDIIE